MVQNKTNLRFLRFKAAKNAHAGSVHNEPAAMNQNLKQQVLDWLHV